PNDWSPVTCDTGPFSTTPSGTGPFEFQWTHNGVDSPGATNSSYTVGPVSPGDAGAYCVIVTGAANSVTNCATLTVLVPTSASGLTDLVRCVGASASFSTTASGTGPFSYQWTKDEIEIGGATNANFSVLSAGTGDAGTY